MAKEKSKSGIIYVLTNPAMPGLVKIGHASKGDVKQQLKDLYTDGVPVPFKCEYAGEVQDADKLVKAFHNAFKDSRPNNKREFFSINADQVTGLLEFIAASDAVDVTREVQRDADAVDSTAQKQFKKVVRPSLSFAQMGIKKGDVLRSTVNKSVQVVVTDVKRRTRRKINFNGEEVDYTGLTRDLTGKRGIRPDSYWTHNGVLVRERFDAYYDAHEEDASASLFNQQTEGQRGRNPSLTLKQMGVRKGDILYFTQDDSVHVKVVDVDAKTMRLVERQGKLRYLHELTRQLRGPNRSPRINPNIYWRTRGGKTLRDLHNEYYASSGR